MNATRRFAEDIRAGTVTLIACSACGSARVSEAKRGWLACEVCGQMGRWPREQFHLLTAMRQGDVA